MEDKTIAIYCIIDDILKAIDHFMKIKGQPFLLLLSL